MNHIYKKAKLIVNGIMFAFYLGMPQIHKGEEVDYHYTILTFVRASVRTSGR